MCIAKAPKPTAVRLSLSVLAAKELKPASKFFRLGMEKFEAVSQAASLKELSRTVKAGGKAGNPSEYFKNLVRPNNPQLLKDTKSVLPDGSYEPLRQRAAGEWLRKALSDSGVGEGAKKKFSGSRLSASSSDDSFLVDTPKIA